MQKPQYTTTQHQPESHDRITCMLICEQPAAGRDEWLAETIADDHYLHVVLISPRRDGQAGQERRDYYPH